MSPRKAHHYDKVATLAPGCARKNRYATKATASQAAAVQTKTKGVPISVYRCDDCRGWHLTHRPRRTPTTTNQEETA